MDRYGNGLGKEGYVKRERVWRVSTKPESWSVNKVVNGEILEAEKKEVEEVKTEEKEEKDELKELLGLDTMPIETEPKTGISGALP